MRLKTIRTCLGILTLTAWCASSSDLVLLGDPPLAPAGKPAAISLLDSASSFSSGGSFSVNTTNREEVRNFFNAVYMASEQASMGWNGNVTNCTAGTTTAAFRDLLLLRVNFYRAMAGVPADVVLDDAYNAKAQQAALMMSAADNLSHNPPSSWPCYNAAGAEGAGNSNLALGSSGPEAIDDYIQDWGLYNSVVGHRRWILYPQTQTMGTGDLPATGANPSANALWVFDENYGGSRPATRAEFVSWPPPGYVPYRVVYARWSFSYPFATFTNAIVTMTSNGVNVPVTLESVASGYGENTLVWYPSSLNPGDSYRWPRPASNVVYTVRVQNVRISGTFRTFNYTVTIFDPEVPGPDTVLPVIAGQTEPLVGRTNLYSFDSVPTATSYQWRQSRIQPLSAVEGAENGLAYFASNTTPGYNVVTDYPRLSGSWAFQLAHPEPAADQVLTYARLLAPRTNAQIQFASMLGYATPNQVARVEVSVDQGLFWREVYSQAGSGGAGENRFNSRTASLSNYVGRSILLRFRYAYLGGGYYTDADLHIGWHFDDITFVNVDELTNSVTTNVVTGNAFAFVPAQATNYALEVRATILNQFPLEWGPLYRVAATTNPPPLIQVVGNPTVVGSQVQFDFTVANYRSGMSFQLRKASSPAGPWSVDATANIQTVVPNSRFRVTAATGGAARAFYLVEGLW